MSESNLLTETIKKLKFYKKTPEDIIWVGSREYKTTWSKFAKLADKAYDNGYGSAEVHPDLLVVGSDFWLERHGYDGAEWWEYKTMPLEPTEEKEFESLFTEEEWLK